MHCARSHLCAAAVRRLTTYMPAVPPPAQLLDGPVDHVWVEALNPVLDDNRTLCLSSGETIPLRERVNLIMEVGLLTVTAWGCCCMGLACRIGCAKSHHSTAQD